MDIVGGFIVYLFICLYFDYSLKKIIIIINHVLFYLFVRMCQININETKNHVNDTHTDVNCIDFSFYFFLIQ